MHKYKRLLNNSLLFSVGYLGSKFIVFLMLPLYTAQMLPSEYGLADVITTTSGLLLPVVSLSVFDGVLRFTMDSGFDPLEVFSNSVRITRVGAIAVLLSTPVIFYFSHPFAVLPLLLVLQSYQTLYTQFAKGINRIRLFAMNGVLLTALTAVLNVIFLAVLKMGLSGYFLAFCIGLAVSNLVLFFQLDLRNMYSRNQLSWSYTRKILKFSLPLIPNSIAWNVSYVAGKFVIMIFLGSYANGMFAVASKIPALLTTLTGIFSQSWELSAIEEFTNRDSESDTFFNRIYRGYIAVLFVGASFIIIFTKLLLSFLVDPRYFSAWKFIPILLISAVFSSLSSFLGSQYVAAKRTVQIFKTTVLGSSVSILLSFLLIKILGINAVSTSTFVGFFIIWAIRHKDIAKNMGSDVSFKGILVQLALLFAQYRVTFIKQNIVCYLAQMGIVVLLLIMNRKIIIDLYVSLFGALRRRGKSND